MPLFRFLRGYEGTFPHFSCSAVKKERGVRNVACDSRRLRKQCLVFIVAILPLETFENSFVGIRVTLFSREEGFVWLLLVPVDGKKKGEEVRRRRRERHLKERRQLIFDKHVESVPYGRLWKRERLERRERQLRRARRTGEKRLPLG